jgi:cytochrome c-type biogenesis protein CcmH
MIMTRQTAVAAVRRAFVPAVLSIGCALAALAGAEQLKVPDAEQFVGRPKGSPITAAVLDQQTTQVSQKLRCPVCQGLSIADSPAAMAQNMKQQVRELLSRGYTEEQILDYFERSYGQFVLLEPKRAGFNWIVWLAPIAGLLIGGWIIVSAIRNLQTGRAARVEDFAGIMAEVEKAGAPATEASGGGEEEDPYLARVRELAYGRGKDGKKR